jgi:hypothetical protein
VTSSAANGQAGSATASIPATATATSSSTGALTTDEYETLIETVGSHPR